LPKKKQKKVRRNCFENSAL